MKTKQTVMTLLAAVTFALLPLSAAPAAPEAAGASPEHLQIAKNWKQSAGYGNSGKKKGNPHGAQHSYNYSAYGSKGGPPPWAPAHGYRRKHGSQAGYLADGYIQPYGLDIGFCNRDVIGALLGSAAGAAIGSQIGKGDDRTLAIIGGTVLGAIVGGSIGRSMDNADRTCVGQALEHAPDGETIVWNGRDEQANYQVTPVATYEDNEGRYCREYQTTATVGAREQAAYGIACRQPDGSWQILQ
jgi:surface antigen